MGLNFCNAIIDQKGRYLYMVLVPIQIESVPTLHTFMSEFVFVSSSASDQMTKL